MKLYLQRTVCAVLLVVIFIMTTSCSGIFSTSLPYRHKQRVVEISGVSYRQVYYVEKDNVVVVSQRLVQQDDNGKLKEQDQ